MSPSLRSWTRPRGFVTCSGFVEVSQVTLTRVPTVQTVPSEGLVIGGTQTSRRSTGRALTSEKRKATIAKKMKEMRDVEEIIVTVVVVVVSLS